MTNSFGVNLYTGMLLLFPEIILKVLCEPFQQYRQSEGGTS